MNDYYFYYKPIYLQYYLNKNKTQIYFHYIILFHVLMPKNAGIFVNLVLCHIIDNKSQTIKYQKLDAVFCYYYWVNNLTKFSINFIFYLL